MLFEIYNDDKKPRRVFWTEQKECIPEKELRDLMRKNNYTLYSDGKVYKK